MQEIRLYPALSIHGCTGKEAARAKRLRLTVFDQRNVITPKVRGEPAAFPDSNQNQPKPTSTCPAARPKRVMRTKRITAEAFNPGTLFAYSRE